MRGAAPAAPGFADEVLAEVTPTGRQSAIDVWLSGLADEQREEVLAVLHAPTRDFPHAAVARALRKRGVEVSESMILHWRKTHRRA